MHRFVFALIAVLLILPCAAAPPVRSLRDLRDPRIPALQGKIARAKIFSAYDQLIAIYKQNGFFDEAARLEREQAAQYRRKKLINAAIIHENNAFALENQLQLFAEMPTTAQSAGNLFTGATLEPIVGCYLGAFIDRDDALGPAFLDENFQSHRTTEQFFARSGKKLGGLFMYLRYGQKFPAAWVAQLKASGTIPHIAWEPPKLADVRDDEYLNDFARAARDADWPIFIRFASEMNGFWTPWHGNPTLYKEKFRLVNRVFDRTAPRVATIWCVNNPPLGNAFDYYPGDDGCDWVGVNFYAVPYHENRRDKPAFDESPLALLEPIYRRFSAKKPIAICEFAASHQSVVDRKLIPAFAIDKTNQLYGALPLRYPRVKMINWFNMNTIRYPTAGKTLNNYLLTENEDVLAAWRAATDTPHFLGEYQKLGSELPPVARPLAGRTLRGPTRLRIWAKTYTPQARLAVALDGKLIYYAQKSGAHTVDLNVPLLSKGRHTLTASLFDAQNRLQLATDTVFIAS
jgi:hypothetical protein